MDKLLAMVKIAFTQQGILNSLSDLAKKRLTNVINGKTLKGELSDYFPKWRQEKKIITKTKKFLKDNKNKQRILRKRDLHNPSWLDTAGGYGGSMSTGVNVIPKNLKQY